MPLSVPKRQGGPQGYAKDCPLTRVGELQATLVGEAMREANVQIHHVYCSPSLRCIQTCTQILKGTSCLPLLNLSDSKIHIVIGLQIDSMPINIEPGLFEWLGWYPENMPDWLTDKEIQEAGFRINTNYKRIVSTEELQAGRESCEEYYLRSFYLTQSVIKETADKGELFFVLSAGI
jgi:ubiquitin-associated and SH3 domain-containing protein